MIAIALFRTSSRVKYISGSISVGTGAAGISSVSKAGGSELSVISLAASGHEKDSPLSHLDPK